MKLSQEAIDRMYVFDPDAQPEKRIDEEGLLRWIEELESGRRQQAKCVLRSDTSDQASFCCLGVEFDLRNPAAWVPDEDFESGEPNGEVSGWDDVSNDAVPGEEYFWKYGIREEGVRRLAWMNDDRSTFPEIAAELRRWFGLTAGSLATPGEN
jgi:hypothetical protein